MSTKPRRAKPEAPRASAFRRPEPWPEAAKEAFRAAKAEARERSAMLDAIFAARDAQTAPARKAKQTAAAGPTARLAAEARRMKVLENASDREIARRLHVSRKRVPKLLGR